MSEGQVYFSPEVTADQLANLLRQWLKESGFRLGLRADATGLDYFQPAQAAAEVTAWPQGRVFNRKLEVRWEQRRSSYAVWVLYETDGRSPDTIQATIPEEFTRCGEGWTVAAGKRPDLYLWGRYDPSWSEHNDTPTWIEVRIPRPLHHPAKAPSEDAFARANTRALFAELGRVDYLAPNGAVQFTRLTEVS